METTSSKSSFSHNDMGVMSLISGIGLSVELVLRNVSGCVVEDGEVKRLVL